MKKIILFSLVLLASLIQTSCGDDSNDVPQQTDITISCNPSEITASVTGSTHTINVSCSGKEWSAYSDDAWIGVAVSGSTSQTGTITLTVQANNSGADRFGSVTVRSGSARKTIKVSQPQPLVLSRSEVYSNSSGQDLEVTVTSTSDWQASADVAWITTKKNGSTLVITTAQNDAMEQRTGTVTVATESESATVKVLQSSKIDREMVIPDGYALVWNDEFNNGTSPATGANGWWYETGNGGWGNNEIQNYVDGTSYPSVCFIEDGILNIKLQKVGSEVRSIRMNTSQAWQYGYFEARLKLPAGKGTWPAFWMMPKNFTTWPGDGEIDIMEEVGYDPNRILSTIHCNKYNNGGTSIESGSRMVPTSQTEFHVYACEWTSTYIRFFVDGNQILKYQNDGTGYNAWPFDAPFYLKLNLAWGGDWGGAHGIDENCLPTTYQVDYVRVFQKK